MHHGHTVETHSEDMQWEHLLETYSGGTQLTQWRHLVETHCGHVVEAHSGHQSCPYTSCTQQDPVLPPQSPSRGTKDNKEEMLKDGGTNQEQRGLYLFYQNIRQEGCSDHSSRANSLHRRVKGDTVQALW